ncbi:MAG: Smr/MutS family protein [Bacillota bacterium]
MTLDIDLHGYTVLDAKRILERFIASAPKDCTKIIVIHGYSRGDAIKTMVQNPNELRSNRIKSRKYSLNQGETILELYTK